ncbi:DUF1127 domain-containing protein [Aestuariivita sp.]|jgi:uncharacterized protein YjiS (DUF1127 family)|uniref:DUF1127 domain-containing protein n=1 Tax=Aestuariivita sp. TaxID=1872407 RepID=UPI0021727DA7|nr:DUF1127 domain-containing protein [Aestuariivita sp.]MCE8008932.1 DUF1127 domain-containing protein [Aestuariivita sp.]
MTTLTQILQITPKGETRLVAFVAAKRTQFARWRLYRRTLAEISALSNRELADLGLHRSELKRVAWQAALES